MSNEPEVQPEDLSGYDTVCDKILSGVPLEGIPDSYGAPRFSRLRFKGEAWPRFASHRLLRIKGALYRARGVEVEWAGDEITSATLDVEPARER